MIRTIKSLFERRSARAAVDFWQTGFFRASVNRGYVDSRAVPGAWAAIDLIASQLAGLPARVFQRGPGGVDEPVLDHPVAALLRMPGNGWTDVEAREYYLGEAIRTGTAYLRLVRDPRDGRVMGWWPILTNTISPRVVGDTGRVLYTLSAQPNTGQPQAAEVVTADDLCILRYRMSDNGYTGLNPEVAQRDALEAALNQLTQDKTFAGKGLRTGGILSIAGKLDKDRREAISQQFRSAFGQADSGSVAVLEDGSKFEALNVTPRDSEWYDTRSLGLQELARVFGVPPSTIGDLSRATFSNIEEQQRALARTALRPWLNRLSAALTASFLDEDERRTLRVGFDLAELVKGNLDDRSQFYSRMIQVGALTRNEVRAAEGLPPKPGGDDILTPQNLSTDPTGDAGEDVGRQGVLRADGVRASPDRCSQASFERRQRSPLEERLFLRSLFEPRVFAVFELILEEELFGLQDALEEDRADEAIAALYLILERRLADMLTPVADDVANAVRRAVLRELNELALDNLASLSLKAFSRSVSEAIARGFREARIIAAEPLPAMMPDERGQVLRQFRARPPRSTKFTTIRMVEAHAVKVYEKRGKQRLALIGPDGKILRSIDVAASGGIVTGADSMLKHAPTAAFPDAMVLSDNG